MPPDPPNLNEGDVSDKPAWVRSLPRLTASQLDAQRQERLDAQRALLAVDDGVERIVQAIKGRGQLDRTLIVFLGDNGYSFGSHRHVGKFCVYEECSHVPLLIRYPGVASREEAHLVSNVDLAATIAEIAGVTPGLPQDGRSHVPLIAGASAGGPDELLLERRSGGNRRFFGVRVPDWTYAEYSNGEKELYDLAGDPYQLVNLAGRVAFRAKQDELAQTLRRLKG